jgi:lysosomal alpha-glucosidase
MTMTVIGVVLLIASIVSSVPTDEQRFDCAPDIHADRFKSECEIRGCLYSEEARSNPLAPKCFYPEKWKNYEVEKSFSNSDDSIVVFLKKTKQDTGFEKNIPFVRLDVSVVDAETVRIRLTDASHDRWEVPIPALNIPSFEAPRPNANKRLYKHSFKKNGILTITRASTGTVVFETNLERFVFADQFIQLIANVPSNELFGLGERVDHHAKRVETAGNEAGRKKLNFHNFGDHPLRDKSAYGHHPFYMMFDDADGNAHALYLRNSNPMDVVMTSTPAVSFRTIGGVLDFFLFLGPSPDDVMRQRAELIGHAPLPPYWSLGFHLSRYGSKDDAEIVAVHERNVNAGLPLDVHYADIEYMDTFNQFTIDRDKFGKLPAFAKKLHADGRHMVVIVDPSFDGTADPSSAGYPLYKEGVEKDIFVKNPAGGLVKGRVWNTALSVFPDFTHPKCRDWWSKCIYEFHRELEFDGLKIDMNEPATFISGQESGCVNNSYDRPQFNPIYPMLLENLTICMSSQHYLGPHYNIHNLYATFESAMTYDALRDTLGKRPFIVSRASALGQGSYAAHWTGDIDSSFDVLRMSVPMVLDFGLFGIPFAGADICGYNYDTTVELCTRWYSLGAFYSFSRSHNDIYMVDQDPAAPNLGGPDGPVFKSAMYSLERRYVLLPFLYSLFFRNSLTAEPVMRSLRYNYPRQQSLTDNDYQFMWGRDLLINAILEEGKDVLDAQFPPGTWYDWEDGSVVVESANRVTTKRITIPLTFINLAVRGGAILPTHDVKQTTTEQRRDLFKLRVFLDSNSRAEGELYWDDGDSLNTKEWETYSHVTFKADAASLTATPIMTNYKGQEYTDVNGRVSNTMRVKQVKVHGLASKPVVVTVDGNGVDFDYDATTKTLVIPKDATSGWSVSLLESFNVGWSDRAEL